MCESGQAQQNEKIRQMPHSEVKIDPCMRFLTLILSTFPPSTHPNAEILFHSSSARFSPRFPRACESERSQGSYAHGVPQNTHSCCIAFCFLVPRRYTPENAQTQKRAENEPKNFYRGISKAPDNPQSDFLCLNLRQIAL